MEISDFNKTHAESFSTSQEIDKDTGDSDKTNRNELCSNNFMEEEILNAIKNCPVVFQSQQIGDPEFTMADKRRIAEELLNKKPVTFLLKFGEYLKEEHLNYFLSKFNTSYEVQYYVKKFKHLLNDHNKKVIQRNRRYEAMKKLEAEGNYFSEVEMEKREPLLYYQMVGQYLSKKEKLIKNRQAQENVIPTFSNFLINKMEQEEISKMVKSQQEEEDKMEKLDTSSDEEITSCSNQQKRWGEDWEEEKFRRKLQKKQPKKQNNIISKKEKSILLQEFQSIMKNNFLNGKDTDFNYSEVDLNPDFDSIDLRTQDEQEKYFDEETYDATVCTDTGVEDY